MPPKSKHKKKSKAAPPPSGGDNPAVAPPSTPTPSTVPEASKPSTIPSTSSVLPSQATNPKSKPVTPAFLTALQSYYDAFDHLTTLVSPSTPAGRAAWDTIPEAPMNQLPKQEVGDPWFERELREQMMSGHPMWEEVEGKNGEGGVDVLAEAIGKVRLEEEEARKEKERKEGGDEGEKGKGKGGKEEGGEKWIRVDVDKMIDAWTGKEGLIVPPGLRFPE